MKNEEFIWKAKSLRLKVSGALTSKAARIQGDTGSFDLS